MKKKMNLFCVLMLVLLAIQIVLGFVFNFNDHMQAFEEGWQKGRQGVPSSNGTVSEILMVVMGIAFLYLLVRSFISFVRFIWNVNRDEVFVWKNVLLLRWAGWGLLIPNVISIVYDILHHIPLQQIYIEDTCNIILGVFCLIVAEVFAIGLKLKEEQDLTI